MRLSERQADVMKVIINGWLTSGGKLPEGMNHADLDGFWFQDGGRPNDKQTGILTKVVEGWLDDGAKLPDNTGYEDVFELLNKLGLPDMVEVMLARLLTF